MRYGTLLVGLLLSACARSSTIPLSADTFQLTATAAPICGAQGAQRVAVKQAAAETIRRGYDKFIIGGTQAGSTVVGSTPVMVQNLGGGTGMIYGGAPMIAHDQALLVKMFRNNDPAAANALSARDTLGPKWPEIVASSTTGTCFD